MRVYLDNCCFNRPFDDQSQLAVRLEAEAKLSIQEAIRAHQISLVWSYIIDFENSENPFPERRHSISPWRELSCLNISETPQLIEKSIQFTQLNIKAKDALHLACAVEGLCDIFLTTDHGILKKSRHITDLAVMNPIDYITRKAND